MSTGGYRANSGPKPRGKQDRDKWQRLLAGHAERMAELGIVLPDNVKDLTPLDMALVVQKLEFHKYLENPTPEQVEIFTKALHEVMPFLYPRLSQSFNENLNDTRHSLAFADPRMMTDQQLAQDISVATRVIAAEQVIDIEPIKEKVLKDDDDI